jgi:aerobic-type carbon monoxide dehydrogenase small subunit (CoxS/CutS family)
MSEPAQSVSLIVNGALVSVAPETTVAAAVLMAGTMTRASVIGEPRGPLCGMGICFECRVTINGVPHQRSCQILCTEGLRVTTPDGGTIEQPERRARL